jgi:hypothetical protein
MITGHDIVFEMWSSGNVKYIIRAKIIVKTARITEVVK